jgi:hypothetical protein
MRGLSSNSHRNPTLRRIMVVMGTAVKVLIGLVLLLPMTAYVTYSLVAAADPPPQHAPIIVEQPAQKAHHPAKSPSPKQSHKPGHDRNDDHGKNKGSGGGEGKGDDGPGTVVVTPSPVATPSPEVFDDHGGGDSSGKGSGDDSSGKGSGHD